MLTISGHQSLQPSLPRLCFRTNSNHELSISQGLGLAFSPIQVIQVQDTPSVCTPSCTSLLLKIRYPEPTCSQDQVPKHQVTIRVTQHGTYTPAVRQNRYLGMYCTMQYALHLLHILLPRDKFDRFHHLLIPVSTWLCCQSSIRFPACAPS